MKEFAKTTQKNKIKSRIIFDERAKELIRSSKEHGYDVHTLRKEFYTPSEVNIYKNKVAIVLWTSNPIGFLIKDSEISKSFKTYFNLLWKMSK